MYARNETELSHRYLLTILDTLRDDYCLVGGWAVYYLVNERYREANGREYLGSRDIDIGAADLDAVRRLDTVLINEMRFEPLSFRYVKYFSYETGKELSSEIAKTVPIHELIELYIDVLVPSNADRAKERAGFVPLDEPVLKKIFQMGKNMHHISILGHQIALPAPEMVISMKLNSVGNRTKGHKRIKDICDITALCLFTGKELGTIVEEGISNADPEKLKLIKNALHREDFRLAAGYLGMSERNIRSIMGRFSKS